MEILEDNRGGNKDCNTSQRANNGGCAQILISALKAVGWIVGICWLLAALGILVGFVSLAALGETWASVVPMDGLSPIVFAGLVCAVVVLFMGIIADVGFTVLRGKAVNFKRLGVGAIVWVIFFLWLIFAAVRNADHWNEWAYKTEAQFELWEEEIEAWEERVEGEWEDAVLNLQGVEVWDSTYTMTFEGVSGAMKIDTLCNRFEELEPYEDRLELQLLQGKKVEVTIENHYEGDRLYRTITISAPDGDTIVTLPVRVLNTPATPRVAQ